MPKTAVSNIAQLLLKASHERNFGAVALELALLASGQLDEVVDIRGKLRVMDVAAGFLLVKEAGGYVRIVNDSTRPVCLDPDERVSFVAAAPLPLRGFRSSISFFASLGSSRLSNV